MVLWHNLKYHCWRTNSSTTGCTHTIGWETLLYMIAASVDIQERRESWIFNRKERPNIVYMFCKISQCSSPHLPSTLLERKTLKTHLFVLFSHKKLSYWKLMSFVLVGLKKFLFALGNRSMTGTLCPSFLWNISLNIGAFNIMQKINYTKYGWRRSEETWRWSENLQGGWK